MAYKIVRQAEPGIFLLEDGRWLVNVRPYGEDGPRVRKTKNTKAEAVRHKSKLFAMAAKGEDVKDQKKDKRRLSELIDIWYKLHGHTLKDEKKRRSKLDFLAQLMGDPPLHAFTAETFLDFRLKRQKEKISDNTCNHDLAYLKAMFNTLIKFKKITFNPLSAVPLLVFDESEITYLELGEAERLIDELRAGQSEHAAIVAEICLSTGCRWGEAQTLRRSQVKKGHIQFAKTKNTQSRLIPIDEELFKRILKEGNKTGRLFKDGTKAFTTGLKRAKITLPDGQLTHVLRHTFSVHFMLDKGNILDLQKILGHKTLHMTLRYAQFHPDYLQDSLTKNPMAQIRKMKDEGEEAS